ncbi:MAG TPA: hypothetical protein DCZ59_08290 [Bacteroidetes bacterium]|nr:hypothetical protein [Bacteroidota bacterium]
MRRGRIRFVWLIAALYLLCCEALAQGVRDSRGRDFWLAIPPSEFTSGQTDNERFLSLLFASDSAQTSVVIAARRLTGTVDTIRATVPPGSLREVRIDDYERYQLDGVENVGGGSRNGEVPSPASIHVVTSHDVSLYAVLRSPKSSDAWLVLPTDALSTDYMVASYTSDIVQELFSARAYPSQFVVVSTEDSTTVNIELSTDRSDRRTGSKRSIQLQRGQSYLVQAYINNRRRDDLTGTLISSSKPVVVIGGHRRSQVPVLLPSASRDLLAEQMPGLETWGRRILVPPLALPSDYAQYSVDDIPVCRVIASADSTSVLVNAQPAYMLDKGKFWDLPLDMPLVIDATKPILVIILDRSANRTGGGRTGDPSMIVVPPTEQFLRSYTIGCVASSVMGAELYREHFVTALIPTTAVASLEVDGSKNYTATVRSILGTSSSIVTIPVTSGAHRLRADSAFGVFVYGYGNAESYGYTGGMAFERLYDPVLCLRAMSAKGQPGLADTIAIIVDSVDQRNLEVLTGIRRVRFTVSFDASSFVPSGRGRRDTSSTMMFIDVTSSISTIRPGDTVGLIVGRHTLGLSDSSLINVDSATWSDGAGQALRVATRYIPGDLVTMSVCEADGRARLFDPQSPKPFSVGLRGYYDLRGQYVGTSLEGQPIGVYFLR